MNKLNSCLAVFSILTVCACSAKNQVSTYTSAKEQAPAAAVPQMAAAPQMPAAPQLESAPQQAPFEWTVPTGWQSAAPSQMRLASFQTPGSGDCSIVMLGGAAGGMEANINRWRGQLGLPDLNPAAIKTQLKQGTSKLGKYNWAKIENPMQPEKAILAAIVPFNDATVFVKLVAPLNSLGTLQSNFVSLVSSLRSPGVSGKGN